MTSRLMSLACVAFLLALLNAWPTGPTAVQVRAQGPDVGTDAQREAGKTLYAKYCVQCHGEKGDGNGYATQHLYPRPRDFTTGKFKVRTTPNGALPTHEDLERIIRIGCRTRRCPPGRDSPTRKCRTSPITSRPSLPTSRTPS